MLTRTRRAHGSAWLRLSMTAVWVFFVHAALGADWLPSWKPIPQTGESRRPPEQGEWREVYPKQSLLVVVQVPGSDVLVAMGDNETILRSEDAGAHWNLAQNVPMPQHLSAVVAMAAPDLLVAVGDRGTILRSSDKGVHWDRVPNIPSDQNLLAVTVVPHSEQLVAVGDNGTVLRSEDRGAHWRALESGVNKTLAAVSSVPGSDTIIAVGGNGTVLRSNDKGVHWDKVPNILSDQNLLALTAVPRSGLLIAAGVNGTVMRSDNQGASWHPVPNIPTEQRLLAVTLVQEGLLIAVGDNGTIIDSEDMGLHWKVQDKPTNERLLSVAGLSNTRIVIAVGTKGLVLRSEDAGLHWKPVENKPSSQFLFAVTEVSGARKLIAVGDNGTVLSTEDSGAQWQVVDMPTHQRLFAVVSMPANGDLVVVGDNGTVLRSEDQGKRWSQVGNVPTDSNLLSVAFSTRGDVLVSVGDNGSVLRSVDRGRTWNLIKQGHHQRLFAVVALPDTDIFVAVGANGFVLRSENRGENWTQVQDIRVDKDLLAVTGVAGTDWLIAVGNGGTLLRSEDKGLHWKENGARITDRDLWAVSAVHGAGYLLTAGEGGVVLRSVDRGTTWVTDRTTTNGTLRGVGWTASGNGQPGLVAVGADGVILRSGPNDSRSAASAAEYGLPSGKTAFGIAWRYPAGRHITCSEVSFRRGDTGGWQSVEASPIGWQEGTQKAYKVTWDPTYLTAGTHVQYSFTCTDLDLKVTWQQVLPPILEQTWFNFTSAYFPARITATSTAADIYLNSAVANLLHRNALRLRPEVLGRIEPETKLPELVQKVMRTGEFTLKPDLISSICSLNTHVCTGLPRLVSSWRHLEDPPADVVPDQQVCTEAPGDRPSYVLCLPDVRLLVSRTSARLFVEAWPDLERKIASLGGCPKFDTSCAYLIAINNPDRVNLEQAARAGTRGLLQELRRTTGFLRIPTIQKTMLLGMDVTQEEAVSIAREAVTATLSSLPPPSRPVADGSQQEKSKSATFLHAGPNTIGADFGIDDTLQARAPDTGGTSGDVGDNDLLSAAAAWRKKMGFDERVNGTDWPPARVGILDTVPDFAQRAFSRPSDVDVPFCTYLKAPSIGVLRSRPGSVFTLESLCQSTPVPSCPTDPVPIDHACFPDQEKGRRVTMHGTAIAATLAAQRGWLLPGLIPTAKLFLFAKTDNIADDPLQALERIPPEYTQAAYRNGATRPRIMSISQGVDRALMPDEPAPGAMEAQDAQKRKHDWQSSDSVNRKGLQDFVEALLFKEQRSRSRQSNVETTLFVVAAGNDGRYLPSPPNRGARTEFTTAWGTGDLSNYIPEVLSVVAMGPRGDSPLACRDLQGDGSIDEGFLPKSFVEASGAMPEACRKDVGATIARSGPAFDVAAVGLSLSPKPGTDSGVALLTHSSAAVPYVAGLTALIDAYASTDSRRQVANTGSPWQIPTPAGIANRVRISANPPASPRLALFGEINADRALKFGADYIDLVEEVSTLPEVYRGEPGVFAAIQGACKATGGGDGRFFLRPSQETVQARQLAGQGGSSDVPIKLPLLGLRRIERMADEYRLVVARQSDPDILDVYAASHEELQTKLFDFECVDKEFRPLKAFAGVRPSDSRRTTVSLHAAALQTFIRCSFHERCR